MCNVLGVELVGLVLDWLWLAGLAVEMLLRCCLVGVDFLAIFVSCGVGIIWFGYCGCMVVVRVLVL